ncbi:hypothetical protein BWQ96_02323 [Gracilariopsis chorda]|uniref:Uncharacterized protein n=1 Tax=Gracilariopsis chorda TaxID=448386 RepID=A0A2V3J1T8_9FLOR|nr:hypothetical protein BWQ96_02323 [Gracilariopsis chorda]|eukprot:PXF47937.1 hypothetical protein BWQ96_02323 [Gracilariopsis chorda]
MHSQTVFLPVFPLRFPASSSPQTNRRRPPQASAAQPPSAQGRGRRLAKRLVGRYELARLSIPPDALLARNPNEEAPFAAAIALVALSILVPPLIPNAPSSAPIVAPAAAAALSVWAVDALALNSLLSRALSLALVPARRIAAHEAAHLLVAYLLGFSPLTFQLPAPLTLIRDAESCGVEFENVTVTSSVAHELVAVALAGVVAEISQYGRAYGGNDDFVQARRLAKQAGFSEHQVRNTCRWGVLTAFQLLEQHDSAYQRLISAMIDGADLQSCVQIIERFVDREELLAPYDPAAATATTVYDA